MTPSVSGIILAGGRSRRLGIDKRSLSLRPHRTQIADTIERLGTIVDDLVVAGDPADLPPGRFTLVADDTVGVGPLAGIIAGLRAVQHDHAIVLACDLPFLNVDLLRGLLGLPRDYAMLVPVRADGTLEMLHAVYGKSALNSLQTYLKAGERRLAGLPAACARDGLAVRTVGEEWLREYDPELRSFFNLNTPDDLKRAQDELARCLRQQEV